MSSNHLSLLSSGYKLDVFQMPVLRQADTLCAMRFDRTNMQKLIPILILLTILISACNDTVKREQAPTKETSSRTTVDIAVKRNYAYQNEQEHLIRKRTLCKRLALYDIESGTQDFELRVWLIPSMWDPSILYILKANNARWTLFHYQYYTFRWSDPNNYKNPVVDSVVMESVRPRRTNWTTYIKNLQLDSLWTLTTESSIKDKTFAMLDGHRYLLELSNKGKYKYVFYTTPEYFQDKDINHKKFIEFKKRLVDPIIYRGMRNP